MNIIRVLIVEDLETERRFFKYLFELQPDMTVVGMAADGEEGILLAKQLQPDVITMDINMPGLDGYQATKRIMAECPTPIIVLSASWDPVYVKKSFKALEVGAVAALPKPYGFGHAQHDYTVQEVVQTIRLMSEVKVTTRFNRQLRNSLLLDSNPLIEKTVNIQFVAIGVSTGGPMVLKTILERLPPDFQVPILIVQHIFSGFLCGFRDWLNDYTVMDVQIPKSEIKAEAGTVYLAPDDNHMGIVNGLITLSKEPSEHGLRPSVSYLFRQAALSGRKGIGCLLTGMGKDGAAELRLMRDMGAITIVQDEPSCTVFGMPGAAVHQNAAVHILPPLAIADKLTELVGHAPVQN